MKQIKITQYETFDGRIFNSAAAALRYEAMAVEISRAFAGLPAPSPAMQDAMRNGRGFVRHDPAVVREAYAATLAIAAREFPSLAAERPEMFMAKLVPVSSNMLGRIICDSNQTLLDLAWGRLMTIDPDGREWDQPFYARNPNPDAKEIKA